MTRAALIVTVAFAAYAVISSLLALVIGLVWRARHARSLADPARNATRLVVLRIAPSTLGLMLSAGVVIPVFVALEPIRDYEPVGPLPIGLAAIGLMVVVRQRRASRLSAAFVTRRIRRQWLQSSDTRSTSVRRRACRRTVTSTSPSPMVALVGVLAPRLIAAARAVIDACSAEELAAIVAHERGHLHARDNLKRWLLPPCAPDAPALAPARAAIHRCRVAAPRRSTRRTMRRRAARTRRGSIWRRCSLKIAAGAAAAGDSAPARSARSRTRKAWTAGCAACSTPGRERPRGVAAAAGP